MLVLTRKQKEQIRIGDQVTVTILRINGSTVRVGIEAPRNVRVVRGELQPLSEDEPEQQSQPPAVEESNQTAMPLNADAVDASRRELILSIRQHLAGTMC